MPETAWAVNGYPPGSSRAILADPVLISSNAFRHVISGSLSLAFLAHTCRALRRDFSADAQHERLLTVAPCSGLRPPPAGRPRRTTSPKGQPLHLRCSTASVDSIFYIDPLVAFRVHTRDAAPEIRTITAGLARRTPVSRPARDRDSRGQAAQESTAHLPASLALFPMSAAWPRAELMGHRAGPWGRAIRATIRTTLPTRTPVRVITTICPESPI